MCYITEGEERNSKRTDGKFLLLEISISRNCSSVKCQNVCAIPQVVSAPLTPAYNDCRTFYEEPPTI